MSDGAANLELWFRVGNLALVLIGIGGVLVKISSLATRFEMVGNQTTKEIGELKTNVAELQKVLAAVAVQDNRLDTMDKQNLADREQMRRIEFTLNQLLVPRRVTDGEHPRP